MLKDPLCNLEAELNHGITFLLALRNKIAGDAPSVGLPDVTIPRQVVQKIHGRSIGFASVQQLRFVGIIREEYLTVRNVLIDLVLRVGGFRILIAFDEMTKAKEVCNISGRHWNCETGDLSVKDETAFSRAGLESLLSSDIDLIDSFSDVHKDGLSLDDIVHEVSKIFPQGAVICFDLGFFRLRRIFLLTWRQDIDNFLG